MKYIQCRKKCFIPLVQLPPVRRRGLQGGGGLLQRQVLPQEVLHLRRLQQEARLQHHLRRGGRRHILQELLLQEVRPGRQVHHLFFVGS